MTLREGIVLAIAWGLAMGAEKLFLDASAHESAWWFQVPGFLALFGFISCLGLAFLAKALGKFWLQRHERYYHSGRARHE